MCKFIKLGFILWLVKASELSHNKLDGKRIKYSTEHAEAL